nr:MAG TPA: Integrase [Caudoviricetes sp.]
MPCYYKQGTFVFGNGYVMADYYKKTFTFEGKRRYVYGKTEIEAIEKRAILKSQLEGGKVEISRNTQVSIWINEWLDNYKEPEVNYRWYKDIKSICNRIIVPAIGHMRISSVKPLHVKKILNSIQGYSSSYNAKIYDIINQIFRSAQENELITQNPMIGIRKPLGVKPKNRRAITDEERKYTLQVAKYHRGGLFILIILYCGLRPQEVVPLRWSDIDFKKRRIIINKALKSDGVIRNSTKTEAGMRCVPIPMILLNRLKLEYESIRDNNVLICTNTRGEHYTKSSINDLWKNFKREMNIAAGCKVHPQKHQIMPPYFVPDDLTLYCYRHTYCTDLQAAGVPINVAKELMGHEDIAVTSKIYTHKSDMALNNAAELIDKYSSVV